MAAQYGLFHAILEMDRILEESGSVRGDALKKQFLRELQPSLNKALAITSVDDVMKEEDNDNEEEEAGEN